MLNELLESEQSDIQRLRALRHKHQDADTQRLISEMLEEKAERVIKLTQLYHYKDVEAKEEG